jgi:hypothetical protein
MSKRAPLSPAARARALDALAALRQPERFGRLSASEAARRFGSSVESLRKVAGRALRREAGRWTYRPREDEAVRTISALVRGPRGPEWRVIEVRGLDQAQKVGRHARAVGRGDWRRVASFEGKYVVDTRGRRHYLASDRAALRRMDRAGTLRPPGGFRYG